jgi:phospholipid transport system transporter-binding protein
MSNSPSPSFHIAADNNNGLRASGEITYANAAQVLTQLPEARGPVDVDLSGLLNADSATLAVLIAWSAHARERGAPLRYLNAPPALHNLARLSDVDTLLLGVARA